MAIAAKSHSTPINREAALLDFVERLRKFTEDRRAVHVRLSQLRPHNRREHHMRIAMTTFDHLIGDYEGALFRLFNDDLVVICKGATVADIDRPVLHLRYLFSEDPLLKHDEDGDIRFCEWYDLEDDYPALLELAQRMVRARARHEEEATHDECGAAAHGKPRVPLDPPNLAAIAKAIAHADLSTSIRRQPVCAVAKDRKPEPVYYEIYTSIEALTQTIAPDVDVLSNQWLFQDLTTRLDRRMIAYLARSGDATGGKAFSVNLNVATLLSPEFLDFDAALNSSFRRSIVIELQLFDVYADLGNFLFARDYLRERGYKFCLDGTTHMSLPLIDREQLGFDLVKLMWSADLGDQLNGIRGEAVRASARRTGTERLILTRCDTEQALAAGESIGIMLYQGHILDEMINRNITRQETIEALSEALARHRAASR